MKARPSHWRTKKSRVDSFTLIELLTVIAIIGILAGLTLVAASGVMKTAARSRAKSEITGLAAGLESYKSDNGAYPSPPSAIFSTTNSYETTPTLSGGLYQLSSQLLYQSLTGLTNFGDVPTKQTISYFTFKKSQLGNDSVGAGMIYVKDPFGNSYGYWSGNGSSVPYNGTNQFDLWSTGSDTSGTTNAMWINNWGG